MALFDQISPDDMKALGDAFGDAVGKHIEAAVDRAVDRVLEKLGSLEPSVKIEMAKKD